MDYSNEQTICCDKEKIRLLAYRLNRTHLSRLACLLINVFIFVAFIMIIKIILKLQLTSILLVLILGNYASTSLLIGIQHLIFILLYMCVWSESCYLIKSFRCKCETSHDE
jgi:hypothetical protein